MENNPLVTTYCWTKMNIDQDKNDETRNEDRDFPVLRLYYDQQLHTHHRPAPMLPCTFLQKNMFQFYDIPALCYFHVMKIVVSL